uniref:Uncharacterized protein n=1 Tax=Populus trichocarpa TaxID=3694 RepID=A9PFM3_POPTR|nr:unknown [Populus trichocarpa]
MKSMQSNIHSQKNKLCCCLKTFFIHLLHHTIGGVFYTHCFINSYLNFQFLCINTCH